MPNRLYFGDCLDVMRNDLPDECVDLIYLDPPFNSKRLYNAFIGGAQWLAFDDTWRWSEAVDDFHDIAGDPALAPTMEGLRKILGENSNLAYLSYMANRLRECWRVLKPTGSIYLHCDPTMSHYLKVVMDGLFPQTCGGFINEIVWWYDTGGMAKKNWSKKHDVILFYSKNKNITFNVGDVMDEKNENQKKRFEMSKRYGSKSTYRLSSDKKYPHDVWKMHAINPKAKERMGYPTQKPMALLDRIIAASSNPGDVVLDPFCGCGTTVHAAQTLDRQWIGIDVCVNACKVIEERLRGHFDTLWNDVEFIGLPKTEEHAKTLADLDKFRFERWAASLVDGMEANTRQRGDGGIDGRGRIPISKGEFIDLVSQVKGGGTNPGDVQAFNGARQQIGADLGIFTCFEDRVTQGMRNAAASAGRFMETPIIQIYTVEDYFNGRRPRLPMVA